jgi:hypothetical protein
MKQTETKNINNHETKWERWNRSEKYGHNDDLVPNLVNGKDLIRILFSEWKGSD